MAAAPQVLAVDVGTVRIGLARTDESGRIALPLETVAAEPREGALDKIVAVARSIRAADIIVGFPLQLDGVEGVAARRSRTFAAELKRRVPCRVGLWDERLTTVVAEQAMRDVGTARDRKKAVVDQVAAALLLQNFLDRRHAEPREGGVDGATQGT